MFSVNKHCWIVLVLLLLLLSFAPHTAAQEQVAMKELRRELSAVKEKIKRERQRFNEVDAKATGLEAELKQVKQDLIQAKDRKQHLEGAIKRIMQELAVLKLTVSELGERVVTLRGRAAERIKAAYLMHRRMAVIDYLISAKSVLDIQKRSRYLVHIAHHDRSQMYSLAKAFKKLTAKRRNMVQLKGQQETSLREVGALSTSLEQQRFSQGKLLNNLKVKKEQRELALRRYMESADKLEGILADVMGKRLVKRQAVKPAPMVVPTKAPTATTIKAVAKKVTPTKAPKRQLVKEGLKGQGLRRLKGRLPLPVQGPVIRKFGAQHHAEFSDVFFVKGLEFGTAAGTAVKAVALGKVIFNEFVPEYGHVVIVDHGYRYYTLYGRLDDAYPLVGDMVKGGETLAATTKQDRWGRNFYFELRYKGRAIDPWRYFAKKPDYQPR